MNRTSLQYKAYKALLETNLTTHERNTLLEAGILQKVADFFGATGDAASMMTGGVKKIFADAKLGRRSATAKKNIEKELNDLKSIAKSAGQDESVVYNILNMILNDAGIKPNEVASPPAASGGNDKEAAADTTGKSGAPVDPAKPETAVPAVVAAAAEIAGKDPEKEKEAAEKSDVGIDKALSVISGIIAKNTKVDKAPEIVSYLFKNKMIQFEGRRNIYTADLRLIEQRLSQRFDEIYLMERWNKMALLTEAEPPAGDKASGDDAVPPEAKKFAKLIDKLVGRFKGVKKAQIAAVLTALDDTKGLKVPESV